MCCVPAVAYSCCGMCMLCTAVLLLRAVVGAVLVLCCRLCALPVVVVVVVVCIQYGRSMLLVVFQKLCYDIIIDSSIFVCAPCTKDGLQPLQTLSPRHIPSRVPLHHPSQIALLWDALRCSALSDTAAAVDALNRAVFSRLQRVHLSREAEAFHECRLPSAPCCRNLCASCLARQAYRSRGRL